MKKGIFISTISLAIMAGGALLLTRLLDDRAIAPESLPDRYRTFLSSNFPKEGIAFVKEDRDFLIKKYEVLLTDGTKVEFRVNGDWKEIKRHGAAVPENLIPTEVLTRVDELFPCCMITKAEYERKRLELKLDNGYELEFDQNLTLIDLDR